MVVTSFLPNVFKLLPEGLKANLVPSFARVWEAKIAASATLGQDTDHMGEHPVIDNATISTKSNSAHITLPPQVTSVSWLDKTTGDQCPRCGLQMLDIYYEDETDLQLGARCEECGFQGFFVNGRLVQLATM